MTPLDESSTGILVFNDKISVQNFSINIAKSFSLKWQKTANNNIIFLDSFDGRLFRAGYTITLMGQNIYIRSKNKSNKNIVFNWPKSSLPKLASEFNTIELEEIFSKLLDVRSLTKILSLKVTSKTFLILDADKKTVARGIFLQNKSSYPKIGINKELTIIHPLRGYAAEVKQIIKTFPPNKLYPDFARAMFQIYKIDLKDYSKPLYALKSKKKISQALYEILFKNFIIMRKNEAGIIDDIDIEFLHDYRVACRRMRSALSLIKSVIDPLTIQMLNLDLKHVGTYSGPLRDFDVYLLREEEYKSLLPKKWPQKDIHAIFVKLKSQRKRAYNKMVKMLKSREYSELIDRWQVFLKHFNDHVKNDSVLLKTTSALIMKWFKKVIRDGKVLTAKDPDEKFHDLRIACKKLRYLLEFFGPLYPEPLIKRAVKQLKKLQENLGDFNDYSVQIETLNQLLDNSVNKQTEFVKTIAGLVTVLDYKMHQLRDDFYALFEEFSSAANIKLYKKLFGV